MPEICETVAELDAGMKLGYNWKFGPFELIDRIGVDNVIGALKAAGQEVPSLLKLASGRSFYRVENGQLEFLTVGGEYKPVVRPAGVLLLEDIKRASKPLAKNGSAAVWDIGDGVACLEFTSKMNSIDPEIMAMIQKAIGIVGKGMKGLVIYNEGSNFSVGANLASPSSRPISRCGRPSKRASPAARRSTRR